jgi:HEPN pEK499 p136
MTQTPVALASRNDSLGFADRTKKNLLYIEQAKSHHQDVHIVTQIINSSLGLIVFPWERRADIEIRGKLLADLYKSGWPIWDETPPSKGLGELIKGLRNGIAHGNVQFSSDDRVASEVAVIFGSENGDWHARISADNLKSFCLKFIEFIESTIG